MANLTLKNIPENLYAELKERARREHRSLNKEILAIVEDALRPNKIDPTELLETARRYRRKSAGRAVTEDELRDARNEGRQ